LQHDRHPLLMKWLHERISHNRCGVSAPDKSVHRHADTWQPAFTRRKMPALHPLHPDKSVRNLV